MTLFIDFMNSRLTWNKSTLFRENRYEHGCTKNSRTNEMGNSDVHLWEHYYMMTSSNGSISRVTGPLCREFTGSGDFPTQRPVTRSFNVFFDLRLSKQSWGWWFEAPSCPLWRHRNETNSTWAWSSCMPTSHPPHAYKLCDMVLTKVRDTTQKVHDST